MRYLVVLLLSLFFVSCQKETQENTLAAETKMDLAYGSDPLQKMDIYLPAGRSTDSTKLMVLVHGGAWMEGDKADFRTYVSSLQQRFPGYAVANINYRLATTSANHFPVQETDMKSAIDYLAQKSTEFNIAQKFVLLGASAGAHLAMLQAYKYSSPKIAGVIDFFGPADMVDMYTSSTSSINQLAIQILMSGTPATNPTLYQQSSPINFVTAQASPTIIFHGGLDPLVPVSESTALKNKLESMGVPTQLVIYPNLGHDLWPTATMNEAFDKIEVFIKANVH